MKKTENAVNKLKEVFALGGSIPEACYYANISKQTYYNWIEKEPELKEEFDRLKERPILKARMSVVRGLNDPDRALRFLERTRKKEFSLRQEITGEDGEAISISVSKEIAEKNE